MSSTTTTIQQDAASTSPRTIKLPSGQQVTPRSEISMVSDEIPIIDISCIWTDDLKAKKAVAAQVREASHRIGFFYAKGHGIDAELADAVFKQGERFCALPMERKLVVDTARIPDKYVGYHPLKGYNRNQRKHQDLSEAFNWAYEPAYDPLNTSEEERQQPGISMWPDELANDLPGFKRDLMAYHTELLGFARKLAGIFALALGMEESYFDGYTRHPEAGMRIIHYPEQEAEARDQNGIGAHTDFECFTIVTQDNTPSGLEVLSKSGYWVKAPPIRGAFVVNIADCFMRQTNDYFVSTVHRVVNRSGRERYSLPFFFGFDRSKKLEAIPSCVSEKNPMKYPIMTSGEYYEYRARTAKTKQTQPATAVHEV